ncbi:MAG: hypothetical protein AB1755_05955 [Candidatus Omnitrophota bacterium]
MERIILLLLLISFLAGCASTSSIVKTTSGEYKVVGYSSDKVFSREAALKKANVHCAKINKEVVVVNEITEYKGIGNEDTSKIINTARKAAWSLDQHDAARAIGSSRTSKDFETTVCFTCE